MEQALKGFMLAAGIAVTCLVIGVGFLVAREAGSAAAASSTLLSEFKSELSESGLTRYDGLEINGSDVINFIKKQFNNSYSDTQELQYIKVVKYGKTNTFYSGSDLKGLRTYGHANYIAPTLRLTGKIVRDLNDVIIGVIFE